jgi:hypothetical protein
LGQFLYCHPKVRVKLTNYKLNNDLLNIPEAK